MQRRRHHQDHAGDRARDPEPGMQQKHHPQIERHPGKIEQIADARPAQKLPDTPEIAKRMQRLATPPDAGQRRQLEAYGCQSLIGDRPHPVHDLGAKRIQDPVEQIKHRHQHAEHHQGRHAAARQHPVIDLQHEQRSGQQQQIGHHAEARRMPETRHAG